MCLTSILPIAWETSFVITWLNQSHELYLFGRFEDKLLNSEKWLCDNVMKNRILGSFKEMKHKIKLQSYDVLSLFTEGTFYRLGRLL